MSAHPISAEMHANIRRIQEVFAEHRSLSYEEWVDGFIDEAHPEHEIGIWLDAADTYEVFARDSEDTERRKDVFKVIGACLTGMREYAVSLVSSSLKPKALSRVEAERIVDHYYGLREVRHAKANSILARLKRLWLSIRIGGR